MACSLRVLEEVTIGPAPDYTSTPVPGGKCVYIANLVVSAPPL
jgi:hypothetical protein